MAVVLLLAVVLAAARPGWIGAVLGLLAVVYLAHIALAGEPNLTEVGLVGIAILLVGELGQWSIDGRLRGRYDAGLHLSRAGGIAVLALLGLGTVILSQVAAGLPIAGGLVSLVAATAASVALLWLISAVAINRPSAGASPER